MTTQQPEALRLADELCEAIAEYPEPTALEAQAATELRRQHTRITELESQLAQCFDAADMATAAAQGFRDGAASAALASAPSPQSVAQEPATVPRFNCWSTNEGDSWFDHPADSQAIYDCLGNDAKVGDEYELTAGWKSVTARYRITEVVGDGEEYEVECISHPHENSAPQSPTAKAAESVPAQPPPPECETEAEKRAFAFGWFKAQEADRAARDPANSVLEDAARYRLVRRGQHWSVIDGIGNDLRAEALDAAIDAARAAQKEGQ